MEDVRLNDASDDDDDAARADAKARARAEREERRILAMALPRPIGKRGGAHESRISWTPDEEEALLRLLPLQMERPSWALIASRLAAETGRPRSSTSVRQHWLRLRNGRERARLPKGASSRAKNFCTRCGALKLGHVCTAGRDGDDEMTVQARRAIADGALEGDDEW